MFFFFFFFLVLLFLFTLLSKVSAFYLPGVFPKDFKQHEKIMMYASRINSINTHIPFDYYQLGFSSPKKVEKVSNIVGDRITQDYLVNTPYEVPFL